MNWEAISAVADVFAALAVLITLVYLAGQLRQAKDQIELSGQRHRADAARDVLASVSDSPHLAPVLAKLGGFPWGDYGVDDPADQVRLFTWCHAWMRTEEMNFRMNSPEQQLTQEQLLKGWLSVPWAAKFWVENRAVYDSDFAAKVDALLAQVEASGDAPADIFASRGDAST